MQRSTPDQWRPCEPGQIQRVVKRVQNKRVYRALQRDIAIGSVLIGFVLSGYLGVEAWANQPADIGGIVCFEVSKIREAIVRGDLRPEVDLSVRRHLAICSHCRARVEMARTEFEQSQRPHLLRDDTAVPKEHVAAHAPAHSPVFSTIGY